MVTQHWLAEAIDAWWTPSCLHSVSLGNTPILRTQPHHYHHQLDNDSATNLHRHAPIYSSRVYLDYPSNSNPCYLDFATQISLSQTISAHTPTAPTVCCFHPPKSIPPWEGMVCNGVTPRVAQYSSTSALQVVSCQSHVRSARPLS